MKKYLLGAIAGAAVLAGAAFGGAQVLAGNSFGQNSMSERLSEKLGISQDQVDTAMDQIHEEHQAERTAEVSTKLDEAVADGVITKEQKQAILDKQAELEAQREKEKEALAQWESDNGLDMSALQGYGVGLMGSGGGHGHRGSNL